MPTIGRRLHGTQRYPIVFFVSFLQQIEFLKQSYAKKMTLRQPICNGQFYFQFFCLSDRFLSSSGKLVSASDSNCILPTRSTRKCFCIKKISTNNSGNWLVFGGGEVTVALAPVQFWEVGPVPIKNFPIENLLCDTFIAHVQFYQWCH